MSEQPLVQVSTPIRSGELPQVVVRVNAAPELDEALEVLVGLEDRVSSAMNSLVSAIKAVPIDTAQAVANLQAAGMGPQPVTTYAAAPPVAPPPPVAAPALAQCPACARSTACPECGGATIHGNKAAKANPQGYNAHLCATNPAHKVVWCKTPIKEALRAATGNNPALIYGG